MISRITPKWNPLATARLWARQAPSRLLCSTRHTARYRNPGVIAIDQLKEIHIEGTLETIDAANWARRHADFPALRAARRLGPL